MDSPPIPSLPRGALERVFASAAASDSLDSFTLKQVRTALAANPIRWECSDKQWKQVRNQIRLQWTALLEAQQAEAPALNRASSSDTESKSNEDEKEEEEEEEEDLKPRTKYHRAAEKNVKVLLGAFGDFLGGLAAGPEESDFEDRSENNDNDDEDDGDDATPAPKELPAKKKRKSIAILSSESDPSGPSDEEEERPCPSKKKKQRKSQKSSTAAAAEKTTKASTSLSKESYSETKRKSSESERRTAAEEITITDSEDSGSDSDAIPKAQQQQPIASTSTSKATSASATTTTMSMRDSDLSEVEDTGFLPGARRRRSRTTKDVKGAKKGKGKAKAAGNEEEEEEDGKTSQSKGKGKGPAASKEKEEKKKQKAERKLPAPKPGDAPKGTYAEEARIKKLKELVTAAGTARPFTASTGAERTLTVSKRTEILEGLLEKLGLAVKGDRMPSLTKAKQVGKKRALDKEMQELGGTAHHTGLRTGKELHAADKSSSDDDQGGGQQHAGVMSGSAKKKQVLAERKQFGAFLGAQSDDSESD